MSAWRRGSPPAAENGNISEESGAALGMGKAFGKASLRGFTHLGGMVPRGGITRDPDLFNLRLMVAAVSFVPLSFPKRPNRNPFSWAVGLHGTLLRRCHVHSNATSHILRISE